MSEAAQQRYHRNFSGLFTYGSTFFPTHNLHRSLYQESFPDIKPVQVK